MVLKYPKEVQSGSDFVTITAHKYTTNASRTLGAAAPGGGVVIYMPNSTPTVSNGQNWQDQKFEGPLGKIKRDIGAAVVGGAAAGLNGVSGQESSGGYGIQEGLSSVQSNMGNIPDAVRQAVISGGAGIAGVSANQMLAYSRQQIFNPNVELLYEGPQMRSFGMNFNFIPKSASEADRVRKIIKYLKIYSTPADRGTLYEIPYVFQVTYGGMASSFMNKFKRAALTSISVQYNGGLDMHATFSNGCPIRTDISLSFMEVDVIVRSDHGGSPAGF